MYKLLKPTGYVMQQQV